MAGGHAAGDLLEVPKLHLQRQCAPLEVILLNAPHQFQHRVIEVDGDGSILADVRLKRLFTTHRLAFPFRDHRSVVNPSCEVVEHLSHLAKFACQSVQLNLSQVKPREDSHVVHLLSRLLSYAPDLLHPQLGDEVQRPVGVNHRQPVRFAPVGGNLRQKFAIAHPSRCRQPCRLTDALFDFACDIHPQFNPFFILRHVEKSLVQRDRLNQVGIVVENLV